MKRLFVLMTVLVASSSFNAATFAVAAILPQIQAGVGASADQVSWIQTAYLIPEVVMIPLSGYLSRLMSTRILFVISSLGFTVFSLACAFAWNIESMIVFRAFQGFLGGAMIQIGTTTTMTVTSREKRKRSCIEES